MAFVKKNDRDGKNRRGQKDQNLLFKRKRFCRFTVAQVERIDYKDVDILKDFLSETSRIIPARLTGTSARYQRQLTESIKIARFLALLPYTDQHRS